MRTVATKPIIQGTVIDPAEEKRARDLTDKIQRGLADVVKLRELIAEAFTTRAWATLGYESWENYTSAEFRNVVSLSRDDQRALNVVLQLEEGMSSRAAAAATGTDHKTAKKDADKATGESSPVGSAASQRALQKRVKDLARSQNMNVWPDYGTKQRGGVSRPTYGINSFEAGAPKLRRITLEEAERYLTGGTIPAGAETYDRDTKTWTRATGPVGSSSPPAAPPARRVGADGKSRPATRTRPPAVTEPEPVPEPGPVELPDAGLPEEVMAGAVADAKAEVARRHAIVAEVAHIASQPTKADRLTHALAALRYAVGELLECAPDLTKNYETKEQIEDHYHVIRGLLGGPLTGNNQHVRRERELKEHYLQKWGRSGKELEYDEVLAEYIEARSFETQ
jgi:hypothetical protein